MAWVVLLRASNVGVHQRFLPSAFVKSKALTTFKLVNLGAAGTFVARSNTSESRLRKAIVAQLPFETDVSICSGDEILTLLDEDPFGVVPPNSKPFLTVLAADPVRTPHLPFHVPNEPEWEVRLISARGRYVLSLYRRLKDRLLYPNPIVEREFGVAGTTRGWSTVVALGKILANS